MHNCNRGIYTDYSNLRATGLTMTDMRTGIFSTRCTNHLFTEVTGCSITANFRGIDWFDNAGAMYMKAEYNIINISGSIGGVGIMMQESNSAGATANYEVRYNSPISITSATGGIVAQEVRGAVIQYNDVIVNSDNINYPDATAIGLLSGGGHSVSCNNVTGTDPTYDNSFGLAAVNSANHISCNTFTGTGRGMFFAGPGCDPSQILDNVMGVHFVGLQLAPNAIIGQQPPLGIAPYNGNRWTGTYASGYGAVNMNDGSQQLLFQNLFTVNSTTNPNYEPAIPLSAALPPFNVDNNGWFDPNTFGSTFECALSSLSCNQVLMQGGGEEDLYLLIASDSTLSADYIPESKAMGRQMLYKQLESDSLLLASASIYQSFKVNHQSSAIGYLYQSRRFMEDYGTMDSVWQQSILLSDSMIGSWVENLRLLDSLQALAPIGNYSQQREIICDSLSYYTQSRAAVIGQAQLAKAPALDSAQFWNQNSVSNDLPLMNEKEVNTAAIDYYGYGKDSLYLHENALRAIAMLCPFAGGSSVYRARVLLSHLGDTTVYQDLLVCQQAGMYRQLNQETPEQAQEKGIRIIPNPAGDQAKVIIPEGKQGICYLTLFDYLGRITIREQLDCSIKSHTLDLKHLPPGVYTVKVQMNETDVEQVKLIISK